MSWISELFTVKLNEFKREYLRKKSSLIAYDEATSRIAAIDQVYRQIAEHHLKEDGPKDSRPLIWSNYGDVFTERFLAENCPEFETMSQILEDLQINGDDQVVFYAQEWFLESLYLTLRDHDSVEHMTSLLGRESRWFSRSLRSRTC